MAATVTRGGFDVGLMSKALSIRNETVDRNLREAAEEEERPAHGKKHVGKSLQKLEEEPAQAVVHIALRGRASKS